MTFTLRAATSEDAAFVDHLEDLCMRDYAAALWGHWESSIRKYGFDPARHRIVEVDGRDVGVLDVWRHNGHWEINKFYLEASVRRQGVGAKLLAKIVDEAHDASIPLRLTVLTSNRDALRFYLREGFHEIARTPERITLERVF